MKVIDLGENPSEFLSIKLHSDAFEDGIPLFYKTNPEDFYTEIADIHKILLRLGKDKPLSINISYEPITEDYIDVLIDLHKEWFPFQYERSYFNKFVMRESNIAIGAFISIGKKSYLIGCVLGEVIAEEKFRQKLPGILAQRGWYDFITGWVDCAHLHSLGVIDEYRKLSIGTKLMNLFIEECKKRTIVAVYTNIINHNKGAIKFVGENNWHYFGIDKKYYNYNDKFFDAKVYFYILDMNWCNLKDISKNDNEIQCSGDVQVVQQKQRGCIDALYGMFNFFGKSNNNDDETKRKEQIEIANLKKINVSDEENKI